MLYTIIILLYIILLLLLYIILYSPLSLLLIYLPPPLPFCSFPLLSLPFPIIFQSSPLPSHHLIHSIRVGTYIYLFILFHSSDPLLIYLQFCSPLLFYLPSLPFFPSSSSLPLTYPPLPFLSLPNIQTIYLSPIPFPSNIHSIRVGAYIYLFIFNHHLIQFRWGIHIFLYLPYHPNPFQPASFPNI